MDAQLILHFSIILLREPLAFSAATRSHLTALAAHAISHACVQRLIHLLGPRQQLRFSPSVSHFTTRSSKAVTAVQALRNPPPTSAAHLSQISLTLRAQGYRCMDSVHPDAASYIRQCGATANKPFQEGCIMMHRKGYDSRALIRSCELLVPFRRLKPSVGPSTDLPGFSDSGVDMCQLQLACNCQPS